MQIRRYTAQDHDAIFQLHKRALKAIDAYIYNGPWEKDFANIEGIYLNNRGEFLVGTIDGKIVAMGGLRKLTDEIVELRRMRVEPALQRNGYGKMMLDILEKRAKELGYKIIELDTSIKQTGAQKFYEKNGYQEIRRETEGWPVPIVFYQKII